MRKNGKCNTFLYLASRAQSALSDQPRFKDTFKPEWRMINREEWRMDITGSRHFSHFSVEMTRLAIQIFKWRPFDSF